MHSLYLHVTHHYFIMSHSHVLPTLDEAQTAILKAFFFLILILQRIGPQKMDDGRIEIVGFWSSTFVSCWYCNRVHSMPLSGEISVL